MLAAVKEGAVEALNAYIRNNMTVAVDETVRLGPTQFRLVSNVRDFLALRWFSQSARKPWRGERLPFELWCISLVDSTVDLQHILPHVDQTYRGQSFLHGYYVTDHFGGPIYLVTSGRCFFVFGEYLERVVWPYFVKYLILLHTIQSGSLFLKAAACIVGDAATLLLGRGGSGKTVFLTQLCQHGAKFITNSHAVVGSGRVTGIASSMRVRNGLCASGSIKNVPTCPGLMPGEIVIDPWDIFPSPIDFAVNVKNLCVIDYQQPNFHSIEVMTPEDIYNYAEQFSLALNVYRLEEDLLDMYQGDCRRFSAAYCQMKMQLMALVQQSRCFRISSDILVEEYRDEVFQLLST